MTVKQVRELKKQAKQEDKTPEKQKVKITVSDQQNDIATSQKAETKIIKGKKLKACPFCGGEAEYRQFANPKHYYSVGCKECRCGTEGHIICKSNNTAAQNKADNAEIWNCRV